MMKRSLFLMLLVPCLLTAQPSIELKQAFLDLTNDGVLMCVSAHPDDEDGATLAYYRMKYGVKTYSVFLTRGEGGQNEKGPELYEELGVLRTAETQAAGEIQLTDVYFLNFMDFGYSKSATEAFQKWGRNETTRRLVYIIRKLKPDVIFSNMNPLEGHGHHQAAAVATMAAFDAAADSTFAPEQLQRPGITVWQPKKFFIRNINRSELGFGEWGRSDVVNNITGMNADRNMDYVDISSSALHMHKTQGMERADVRKFTRGQSLYKLIRASSLFDRDTTTFFGGIDFWNDPSMKSLIPIHEALSLLRIDVPRDSLLMVASLALNQIVSMQRAVRTTPLVTRMLAHWREELERLVHLSCEITASFTLLDSIVVAKQHVSCVLEMHSPSCKISGVKYDFSLPQGWAISEPLGIAPMLDAKTYEREFTLVVGESPVLTLPKSVAQYHPIETEQNVVATIQCSINGYPFTLSAPATFDVAPLQSLLIVPKLTRMSPLGKPKLFEYKIKSFRPGQMAGNISVQVPAGWTAESVRYKIENEDSSVHGTITVGCARDTKPGEYPIRFKTEFATQEAIVRVFDAVVAKNINVGIIKSYDNTLEAAVKELGIPYKLLDEKDLEGSVSKYTTIVVDIRAYLVREDLKKNNARLLQYVNDGGNLVVMYQRPQEWKPEYSPYPFGISDKRVTVEEAPIDILALHHPLLNYPNVITDEDWRGWKQERAVYFPINVPPEFVRLLSSHDPGDAPLTTGYLTADLGKGSYMYTSYVWYRQLKEMNPGAFRCFANMISYPSYKKSE